MTTTWIAVLVAALAAYLLKLAGWVVPTRWLDRPWVTRVTRLLPVALLAALVVVQTVGDGARVVLDARLVGLGVAVVALVLRAPFVVVVVAAAVAAAVFRAVT